jgi:hypothetical protein
MNSIIADEIDLNEKKIVSETVVVFGIEKSKIKKNMIIKKF